MSEASRLDRGSPETPRRRYLTMIFSDLCNSTTIAGQLEPEDYCDLLDWLRTTYHRIIEGRGGQIAQISGDGMLAVFGHPQSRENDGRRAVQAALDLHEAVRAERKGVGWQAMSLRLHTGIHSGLVLVHEGDDVRGRFELLGSATNIASRLCDMADADQILVTEASLGPERHLFDGGKPRLLHLKGKEEPVAILSITGCAGISGRYAASIRGGLTPFIGRANELARLEASLADTMTGRNGLVVIEGPPGVGKTRLAEELLRRASALGYQVHRGECETEAEPLQPFLQIARAALGLHRPTPGRQSAGLLKAALAAIDPALVSHHRSLARSLSLVSSRDDGGDTRRSRGRGAIAALCAVFDAVAERAPLVLFVDDWHLADDASREMVAMLRGLQRRPLFILVTARPIPESEGFADDGDMLELAPFTEGETEKAVTCLLGSRDPFTVANIRASSGGNPLFVEELCHSIASGQPEEGPHGGSPWLDVLIGSRFSRLPEAQARLVRTAAVIGNIIPCWLLELITGCAPQDPLLAGLADEDFIFPSEREGTLRFKHGITRDVIYDSVGLRERRQLHLRIAEALRMRGSEFGEEEPYEALAYHYGAGGDDAATAHYAELAGDKATAVSALDRAQTQYRAALAAIERLPESDENIASWTRVVHSFGRAGVFDPSRDQVSLLERAVKKAYARDDRSALVWAEYWLGYIYYALGEPAEAISHYERALDAAAGSDDLRPIVQIRAALGQAKQAACDYTGALPLLDEVIETKNRSYPGTGSRAGVAYSLSCKGFALSDMGRFAEGQAYFDEAMAAIGASRPQIEASVLDQRSAACLWQGRMEEALRFAEEGERLGERIRSRYDFAMSRALAAYARWKIDRSPAHVQQLLEATSWLEEGARNQNISLNYGWLAETLAELGRDREALRYAALARRRARRHDPMGEAMALRAVARIAALEGRSPEPWLERAFRSARARNAPHEVAVTHLCEAELARAAGEDDRARASLAQARQGFAALDMAWFDREAIALSDRLGPDRRPASAHPR
jgi:class 3 adenylate cyclase/tetratricopeptide (TPR) repeat protein